MLYVLTELWKAYLKYSDNGGSVRLAEITKVLCPIDKIISCLIFFEYLPVFLKH